MQHPNRLRNRARTRDIGKHYEHIACQFLANHGLELLDQNSQFQIGEIDLVMRDKTCLVFVEVRYRQNANFGEAEMTISLTKQNKIKQAAQLWMLNNNLNIEDTEFRFDVFAITGKSQKWIINAF
ncbi:YraN family protein [Gilliamella sp. A7]|uniref:YraN family protein n=1 Tax=Gilliamella sp. A7 TaxID=1970465 RepID=UPI000A33700F|nr:YraN family protein [Gilliamella sp. A7]OTQ59067.1 YraN family protein [Gilliamella sp. A7]